MIYRLSDNVFSPLGSTTAQNLEAVRLGRSALGRCNPWGLPSPVTAAVLGDIACREGLSRLESMAAASAGDAIKKSGIDPSRPDVVFILSTVKGNINNLRADSDFAYDYLGASALRIAKALGVTTLPVTVCNACISGVSAIILASRLLEGGYYKYAIVTGADELGPFIVSGFDSIGSMSKEECRPFDSMRNGLNLGEAAATIVFSAREPSGKAWGIRSGAVRNDASGTVAPARDAAGLRRAILAATKGTRLKSLRTINAHGTATLFNDQMESVAFAKTRLGAVPVSCLKGYFGHTMGAAGLIGTIVTMASLSDGYVLPVRGYSERGVSGRINICTDVRKASAGSFLKTISGFGGCNAAIVAGRKKSTAERMPTLNLNRRGSVRITPEGLWIDGQKQETNGAGIDLLTDIYRRYCNPSPRFFKMDLLCRLGFLAADLLVKTYGPIGPNNNTGVILFNRSSSIDTDRKYLARMGSPSLFVYTLPNIVTGEIAIRHGFGGETSFYVLPQRDSVQEEMIAKASFLDDGLLQSICGWVDWESPRNFEADLYLIENQKNVNMDELILELKEQIIEALNLEGMKPQEIDTDAPLFGSGLGLDSIDALELIVLMEKKYGVKLANPAEGKAVFKNVRTMAEYISAHKK